MELNSKPEAEANTLEEKQNTISEVKQKFFNAIKRKLGDLFVEGLSEFFGNANLDPKQLIILKLPQFLKPIFNLFRDDYLLIDTSLMYILYSLELIDKNLQFQYEVKLSKIANKKKDLQGLKELLWIDSDTQVEFITKFILPAYLAPIYPILEEQIQNLVIFGLLKIFDWLDLLNLKARSLISNYEQSFVVVSQAIKNATG